MASISVEDANYIKDHPFSSLELESLRAALKPRDEDTSSTSSDETIDLSASRDAISSLLIVLLTHPVAKRLKSATRRPLIIQIAELYARLQSDDFDSSLSRFDPLTTAVADYTSDLDIWKAAVQLIDNQKRCPHLPNEIWLRILEELFAGPSKITLSTSPLRQLPSVLRRAQGLKRKRAQIEKTRNIVKLPPNAELTYCEDGSRNEYHSLSANKCLPVQILVVSKNLTRLGRPILYSATFVFGNSYWESQVDACEAVNFLEHIGEQARQLIKRIEFARSAKSDCRVHESRLYHMLCRSMNLDTVSFGHDVDWWTEFCFSILDIDTRNCNDADISRPSRDNIFCLLLEAICNDTIRELYFKLDTGRFSKLENDGYSSVLRWIHKLYSGLPVIVERAKAREVIGYDYYGQGRCMVL